MACEDQQSPIGESRNPFLQLDLQNDKIWDIWRVEGPAFVWHFRGAPHVHAYINVGAVASGTANAKG